MGTEASKPSASKASRKPGTGHQLALLLVLLVTPIPAYLAAEARLELMVAGLMALTSLVMVTVIKRL